MQNQLRQAAAPAITISARAAVALREDGSRAEPYAGLMVDLRPWRVPVAVILLAAMAVRVGVSLVAAILASARSSGLFSSLAGGIGAGEIFLCVALAAVCWWCTADDVRGARGLAITAFVLVGAQILLSVGASLAMVPLLSGPDTRIVTVLIQLTWLVVPILAAAVLLRCALASDAVRRDTANASPAQALPAADPTDEPGGESEASPAALSGGCGLGTGRGRRRRVDQRG